MSPLSPRSAPGVIDHQLFGEETDNSVQRKSLTDEEFNQRRAERHKKNAELSQKFDASLARINQLDEGQLANVNPGAAAARIQAISNEILQEITLGGVISALAVTVTGFFFGGKAALITALFCTAILILTYIGIINKL